MSKIQSFSLFFYKRYLFSSFIWISLVVFGVLSYAVFMQRQGFPSIEVPFGLINVEYRIQDKQKVDNDVVLKLLDVINNEDYVNQSTSISTDNNATIIIQFESGTSSTDGVSRVDEAIGELTLPQGANVSTETISATKFNNKYDVLISMRSGILEYQQLQEVADDFATDLQSKLNNSTTEVIPAFTTAKNISTGKEENIQTNFDWLGTIQNDDLSIDQSITIGIMNDNEDVIRFNEELSSAINTIKSNNYYKDVEVVISADFANEIKQQISLLQGSLLAGLVIVILACCLFIGIKAGFLAALGMFVSLSSTVGILFALGITLNTITLFGLILALGLIVDDTIIMVEAIDSACAKGLSMVNSIKQAAKRIALASLAGTLTTVLAFSPLLFVRGILGDFIIVLPQTIIIALSVSFIVSLTFIPFASRWLPRNPQNKSLMDVIRNLETKISIILSRIIMSARSLKRKVIYSIMAILLSFLIVGSSFPLFNKLRFDIFPVSKDSNSILINFTFQPGSNLNQAIDITEEVNATLVNEFGEYIESVTYLGVSNQLTATARVQLTPFSSRSITSQELLKELNNSLSKDNGARITVSQLDAGPPRDDFPLTVQIKANNPSVANDVADNLANYLEGNRVTRQNGEQSLITEVQSFGEIQAIKRVDGERVIEVNVAFADDDVSALVVAGQSLVEEFIRDEENIMGLSQDDFIFDYGGEGDNQDSFKTVIIALPFLLLAMFILLSVQFRSLSQPLLILLAVPFSLLGVAIGLNLTNNPISFFVMVGFFALIGISVNNSILLTDYANQSRRKGYSPRQAVASAVEKRTRPLLTTATTSIVALIPLTFSDPFWESLTVTIMFGLASSSLMVLFVFPYYYLMLEAIRSRLSLKKYIKGKYAKVFYK